ncbi:TlpA disulfide reductase family protein [Croceitalea rosinachiae]|uniref:TlpA disulfide reductase family protein n=1 Tax=Croceitalea rosinachiae TaxID=3075596 RepID=A0ABU3ADS9_9FLAO|nr:TlpA disulfide reductase family protein [Croceitalea sp. F388]MDT0607667.1 TlpA disulfide reductase family protein [Croceitalea sp. F388]
MIRKLSIFSLFALLIVACNSNPSGYTIDGELRGELENGTQVFLKTTDSLARGLIDIDTTTIENNQFTFTGEIDELGVHYLFFDGVQGNAPLILENGTISFKAQKDSLAFSKVKGTAQNDMFMEFLVESRRLRSMSKSMNDEFSKARMAKDTANMEALRAEYLDFQEEAKSYEIDFIEENPSALIAVLILERIIATKTLPLNEVESLYGALAPEIKATEPGKRVEEELKKAKGTAIGSQAPEFSGPTPSGELLALNDVKGKLTLIDFWAAWCKPCRAENPNIVSVYEKYKDKGLNVVSVSLDRKEEDWLKAIEADGLEWNHISNLQYFKGPIAQLYNINAIPAAFLLDENGVIVAKDLRGPALEQKVSELLN